MNLHGIVSGLVGAVNPPLACLLTASTGTTTGADYTPVPTYAAPVTIMVQVQSLTYDDLMQTNGLNIQGEKRAMYIQGNWNGVVRSANKGGDLITTPDGKVWLCAMVLENLSLSSGWTKIAAVLQNGS